MLISLCQTLLRDTASSVVNKADSVGPASSTENGLPATHAEKEKKGVAILITEELCAVLLELAFHRLLMKSPEEAGSDNMSWIQDFSTAIDYRQSRGRLVSIYALLYVGNCRSHS